MPWAGSTRLPALAPPLPTGRRGVPWEGRGSHGCVLSEGRGCPGVPDGLGKHSKHLLSLCPAILSPAHPLTEGASHAR